VDRKGGGEDRYETDKDGRKVGARGEGKERGRE